MSMQYPLKVEILGDWEWVVSKGHHPVDSFGEAARELYLRETGIRLKMVDLVWTHATVEETPDDPEITHRWRWNKHADDPVKPGQVPITLAWAEEAEDANDD